MKCLRSKKRLKSPDNTTEERAAREVGEMAALDAVGDYEGDPNMMMEESRRMCLKTSSSRL
jgi:hypothetical protein